VRVHRDAGGRQGLQVPPCRGHRHLQLGGELRRGDAAARLQIQESGDETIGAHVILSNVKSAQLMSTLVPHDDLLSQQDREDSGMFRGLTTVNVFADDVAAAAAWYTTVFGVEPYFARPVDGAPVYVEFRVGDYQHEFGIVDGRFQVGGRPEKPGGAVVYWAVDDVRAELDRLVALGATVHDGVVERGPGFVTASVLDPFGNVLGFMYNQHYLDVLATRAG
jgi:predicted enzyme related to lactoylglutathione lyase